MRKSIDGEDFEHTIRETISNKKFKVDDEPGLVSSLNSGTLSLTPGQSFTGSYEQVLDYSTISILTIIDFVGGESGTLSLVQSTDASGTYTRTKTVDVSAAQGSVHTLSVVSEYFRVEFAADQGTSCTGYLQVMMHKKQPHGITSFIGETLTTANDCHVTRSVLVAQDKLSQFRNVSSDIDGYLNISLPRSTYNEVITVPNTPIFNYYFPNNRINTQLWDTSLVSGGTISVADAVCSIAIGTVAGNYAVLRTNRTLSYFGGTSNLVRFSCMFSTPVTSSIQRVGLANATSEFSFGYDGLNFGILRAYGGKLHEISLEITTAASVAGNISITLPITSVLVGSATQVFTIPVTNAAGLVSFTASEITAHALFFAFGWQVHHNLGVVTFTHRGVDEYDTSLCVFAPGTTGALATGGFVEVTLGVSLSEAWTYESAFNTNPVLCQTLNKTLGNVYVIQFSWLGFNEAIFSVLDPSTGRIEPVHRIQYANTATTPTLLEPTMQYQVTCASVTSTTALTVKTVSVGAFTQGIIPRVFNPLFSSGNEKTGITTETVVIAFRVAYSVGGSTVRGRILPQSFSFSTDGNKPVTLRIYTDVTIANTSTTDYPNWAFVNSNSILQYTTTPTTYTGGTQVSRISLGGTDSFIREIEQGTLSFDRGSIFLISATSSTANNVTAAMTWVEDL